MSYKIVSTCIGCTACTKRCPTEAITGERNSIHIIDPELCIDCGACGVVCPVECIHDGGGDVCKEFPRREWPKAIVIEENCIGSGCELCINIDPPREALKKRLYQPVELLEAAETAAG